MSLALPNQETQTTGVEGLVEHLRCARHVSESSAQELADRFGLRKEFVKDVLDSLEGPDPGKESAELFWKAVGRFLVQGWDTSKGLWLSLTARPMPFVVVTGLTGYLIAFGLQVVKVGGAPLSETVSIGQVLVATFLLHFACFARHGMIRYPLYSACVVTGASFLAFVEREGSFLASGLDALLVGSLYGFLGGVAALVGGAFIVRRRARTILSLSRQEALDRLFILKERFSKRDADIDRPARKRNVLGIVPRDPKWPLIALIGGFVFGILRVLVLGGYQHVFSEVAREPDPVFTTFRIFSFIVTSLGFIGIGFLSGGVLRAIASQFLAYAGLMSSNFFRLGGFGPDMALRQFQPQLLGPMAFLLVLSGVLSGTGARVEEGARRERRKTKEDPASLIAEMILLERMLSANAAARCVVSVDVSRSTAMKADQDPLVVEWSFREYQRMLAESAEQGGGFVLSTSGDGAILTFSDCARALQTSKDILTRLSWFNMRVNRLESPFRVRIGIHTEEVQGDLNDVQFSQVIDIASHVQNHAPVGGILVTEPVAGHVTGEPLSELKEPIEGWKVLLVVNPTFGP